MLVSHTNIHVKREKDLLLFVADECMCMFLQLTKRLPKYFIYPLSSTNLINIHAFYEHEHEQGINWKLFVTVLILLHNYCSTVLIIKAICSVMQKIIIGWLLNHNNYRNIIHYSLRRSNVSYIVNARILVTSSAH